MRKLFFLTSFIISGLFITNCYAQDEANNIPAGSAPAAAPSSVPPPMSDEDFRNSANKNYKESQKKLLDEAKQIRKSSPDYTPPTTTDEDSDTDSKTRPASPTQPPQPQTPAATYPAPTPTTPAPAPAANQPYSGFGGGGETKQPAQPTNSGTGTSNGTSKGSNWNMGY